MHALSKLLLAALSLTTLVGARHQSRVHSRYRRDVVRRQSTNKTYTVQDFYQGEDFFKYVPPIMYAVLMQNSANCPHSNWDFFTGSDPTDGNVNYQSKSNAQSKGLAYVNDCDNSTVLAVDSTSTVAAGGNRDSCVMPLFIVIYEYLSRVQCSYHISEELQWRSLCY
jgi:hypothetical protein